MVIIFDTTRTMIGFAQQAVLMKRKSNTMPCARQALLAEDDSIATSVGAMVSISPTSAYVESTAGGRTGLTSVTVVVLFILAAFFTHRLSLLLASS